jgi:hypothetical protein
MKRLTGNESLSEIKAHLKSNGIPNMVFPEQEHFIAKEYDEQSKRVYVVYRIVVRNQVTGEVFSTQLLETFKRYKDAKLYSETHEKIKMQLEIESLREENYNLAFENKNFAEFLEEDYSQEGISNIANGYLSPQELNQG